MEHINIGGVSIEKTAALAPMASVADRSYRSLCRSYGASLTYTEMVSTKALHYGDSKTAELCTITPAERPCALQLFGNEPDVMAEAVRLVEPFAPDFIDINMGCPVPKIAGNGCGAALMKTPALAAELVSAAVNATKIPITVKIRAGWDEQHINAVDFAKRMADSGASAIAVHGRTRSQLYTGSADWGIIERVKKAVSVPVIGNGDVASVDDCVAMYAQTGCDLVMLGRGSYGNPFIFDEIRSYYNGTDFYPPGFDDIFEVMQKHIAAVVEHKGETMAMREARKLASWYLKGYRGSAFFRGRCNTLSKYSDVIRLIDEYRAYLLAED